MTFVKNMALDIFIHINIFDIGQIRVPGHAWAPSGMPDNSPSKVRGFVFKRRAAAQKADEL